MVPCTVRVPRVHSCPFPNPFFLSSSAQCFFSWRMFTFYTYRKVERPVWIARHLSTSFNRDVLWPVWCSSLPPPLVLLSQTLFYLVHKYFIDSKIKKRLNHIPWSYQKNEHLLISSVNVQFPSCLFFFFNDLFKSGSRWDLYVGTDWYIFKIS